MCGIIGIFDIKGDLKKYRERALKMASMIRYHGPDGSGIFSDEKIILMHERLSIVDVEGGAQPLVDSKTGRVLIVNGEIYSHQLLRSTLRKQHDFQTKSDCEVLLYLYDEFGVDFVSRISGIFAFALYDPITKEYLIARNHMGICPLYIGWDDLDCVHISSEMKCLVDGCCKIQEFPPGHYYSKGTFVRYYSPEWMSEIPSRIVSLDLLRDHLEDAVQKQLMADVPYGVLISGGLDSSIIAAIAMKCQKGEVLHSFAVGLRDSPDLVFARKVATFLGTIHHEILFTVQEGIDALRDVIYHLETFDVTTIRASTPMYLMARKIKSLGIKMVLSGEGSDEIFGGYLYFHMAPDAKEFQEECVRKLSSLSEYDCLRANKSMAAWGVEVRVPFLDKEFLDFAMSIRAEDKMCPGGKIEKEILRKAFEGYIPTEILWRQKEQFSDGVGYGWIDSLKKLTQEEVTDAQMEQARVRFPLQTPSSKEEYFYRSIFESIFRNPYCALTVPVGPSIACSTPTAIRWSKDFQECADPSGRSVKVHDKAVPEKAMGSI